VVILWTGSVCVGYIFGSISFLIQKWNYETDQYQEKREDLQTRMDKYKIPQDLKIRVYKYFEYQWKKRKVLDRISNFEDLSEPLKKELAVYMYRDLILNVPLFSKLEVPEIMSIIKKLK